MITKKEYNKLIEDAHDDMSANGLMAEDCLYEVADCLIEPAIETFLKKMGVTDVKGRFADDIYSGTGF